MVGDGWLVGWLEIVALRNWFFSRWFLVKHKWFSIDCDKGHLDFYVSNLMNMRERGYRCWMLTGCPFIQHILTFIILHFVATHFNHRQCCNVICTVSIFSLVRNVAYGFTWKDIARHMCYVFHLQPFVRFEWITREREVYVSAGAKFFSEKIRVFTAMSDPKPSSVSWRLWRQSSSLGGPTPGALSHHQFNLEDVDQQRPLVSDVS